MRCPGLYGYRFSTAYTCSPRATIRPSSSDIVGMSMKGCFEPADVPSPPFIGASTM